MRDDHVRGRATCRNISRKEGMFECSECGAFLDIADMKDPNEYREYQPRYCCQCGRRLVKTERR